MRSRVSADPHSEYWDRVSAADRRVDAELASIRRKQDAGIVTAAQAAGERAKALQAHLAEVRRLRQEFLGGD